MRASGFLSLASIADAVWDEVISVGHTISNSSAHNLRNAYTNSADIKTDYTRRTAYTYGPTNLAAGATYVPVAGTVVTLAALDAVADEDFRIMHGAIEVFKINIATIDVWLKGYVGMLYCDGTNVGIKNADAAGRDLVIEGFTI